MQAAFGLRPPETTGVPEASVGGFDFDPGYEGLLSCTLGTFMPKQPETEGVSFTPDTQRQTNAGEDGSTTSRMEARRTGRGRHAKIEEQVEPPTTAKTRSARSGDTTEIPVVTEAMAHEDDEDSAVHSVEEDTAIFAPQTPPTQPLAPPVAAPSHGQQAPSRTARRPRQPSQGRGRRIIGGTALISSISIVALMATPSITGGGDTEGAKAIPSIIMDFGQDVLRGDRNEPSPEASEQLQGQQPTDSTSQPPAAETQQVEVPASIAFGEANGCTVIGNVTVGAKILLAQLITPEKKTLSNVSIPETAIDLSVCSDAMLPVAVDTSAKQAVTVNVDGLRGQPQMQQQPQIGVTPATFKEAAVGLDYGDMCLFFEDQSGCDPNKVPDPLMPADVSVIQNSAQVLLLRAAEQACIEKSAKISAFTQNTVTQTVLGNTNPRNIEGLQVRTVDGAGNKPRELVFMQGLIDQSVQQGGVKTDEELATMFPDSSLAAACNLNEKVKE